MSNYEIKFTVSQAAIELLFDRAAECARENYHEYEVCRELTGWLTCAHVIEPEKPVFKCPDKLLQSCKAEFPESQEFVVFFARTQNNAFSCIVAYPGKEEELLAEMRQIWGGMDAEKRLAPLLEKSLKEEVHAFLASRSIYSLRGKKTTVRDRMLDYCKGYTHALKMQGRPVPMPYVLFSNYGFGHLGVAYMMSTPPGKLLEEVENEFAAYIVMES